MRIAIENNDNKDIKKMSGSMTIMRIWEGMCIIAMKIMPMPNILFVLKIWALFLFKYLNFFFSFNFAVECHLQNTTSRKVKYDGRNMMIRSQFSVKVG